MYYVDFIYEYVKLLSNYLSICMKVNLKKISKEVSVMDDRLAKIFQALGDRTRFKIFCTFVSHNNICVTELSEILDISVPATSQQLKHLELVGLIIPRREGQKICYEVNTQNEVVESVITLIKQYC